MSNVLDIFHSLVEVEDFLSLFRRFQLLLSRLFSLEPGLGELSEGSFSLDSFLFSGLPSS